MGEVGIQFQAVEFNAPKQASITNNDIIFFTALNGFKRIAHHACVDACCGRELPLIGGGQGRTPEHAQKNAECCFWWAVVVAIAVGIIGCLYLLHIIKGG